MSPRLSHHFHIPYNPSMFSTTTRQKPTASPDNFAHQPRAKDTKNTPAPGAPPRPLWAQENGSFASRRIRSLLHSSSSGLLETLPDTLGRSATEKSRPRFVLRAAHERSKSAAQRATGSEGLRCAQNFLHRFRTSRGPPDSIDSLGLAPAHAAPSVGPLGVWPCEAAGPEPS